MSSVKVCCQCKIEKSIEDFFKRRDAKDGRAYYCKSCAKIRRKQRKERCKNNKIEITHKTCSICNQEKEICEFSKHPTMLDGHRPECKSCNKKKSKDNKISNLKCLDCNKSVNTNNSRCEQCEKKYQLEGYELARIYNKRYCKEYRDKNRDSILEKERKFREENRSYIRKRHREYLKKRMATDPQFKSRYSIRRLCNTAIANHSAKKLSSTEELLGISIDKVRLWIEMNFEEGMSWNNHGLGGWTIDHAVPCSSFNLNDIEQQKKCMHWSNLTPMWHSDNNSKNNTSLNEYISKLDKNRYKNLFLHLSIKENFFNQQGFIMTRFDWVPCGEEFSVDGQVFRKIDFDTAEDISSGEYQKFDSMQQVSYNDDEMFDVFALDDENLEW